MILFGLNNINIQLNKALMRLSKYKLLLMVGDLFELIIKNHFAVNVRHIFILSFIFPLNKKRICIKF